MTQPDIFDENAPWAEWLPELRQLLRAYNAVPEAERFVDEPDAPSRAMRSYLRIATFYPGRAARAVEEVQDVLGYGLGEEDVAANLATMPAITPPPGRTREQCLEAMLPHLVAFLERDERVPLSAPDTEWEWGERFPQLSHVVGYFHQDAGLEHPGAARLHEAVIDGYLADTHPDLAAAAAREIDELRELGLDERALATAARWMGSNHSPPDGLTHDEWFAQIADRLRAHLDAIGYEPPDGLDPAYPPHDIRARRQA